MSDYVDVALTACASTAVASYSRERQKDVGRHYARARGGRANLHARTWKSWALIGGNYGGVRRWMQRSGEENTDGDGVEQDLFQKNPCPPGFQCEKTNNHKKKRSSLAWSVADCIYSIRK